MALLYHATYLEYLPSIQKEGLLAGRHVSYRGSNPDGCVYFCHDEDVAVSFAECADNIEDDVFNSGIVLLAIDPKKLDCKLYREDKNIAEGTLRNLNLAYAGVVPPDAIIEIRYDV